MRTARVLLLSTALALAACGGDDGRMTDGGFDGTLDRATDTPIDLAPEGGDRIADAADLPADSPPERPPDAGPDVPSDRSPDLAPDAGECRAPQFWRNVAGTVERFEDLGAGPVVAGRSARVRAQVLIGPSGCQEFGRTMIARNERERTVTVRFEVFENVDALAGACPPPTPQPRVVVLRGLAAGRWQVIDGSAGPAGDPVSIAIEVQPCGGACTCTADEDLPAGTACALDCQCRDGLACIGFRDEGAVLRHACERSCADHRDCAAGERCVDIGDGPARICQRARGDLCAGRTDCPPGFECVCPDEPGCACVPRMALGGPECCRSDDCAPGQSCVEYFGVAGSPLHSCQVRCRSDFDCPGGALCQGVPDGPQGVCYPGE